MASDELKKIQNLLKRLVKLTRDVQQPATCSCKKKKKANENSVAAKRRRRADGDSGDDDDDYDDYDDYDDGGADKASPRRKRGASSSSSGSDDETTGSAPRGRAKKKGTAGGGGPLTKDAMSYCIFCKRKTKSIGATVKLSANNRTYVRGECDTCHKAKTRFV